MMSAPRRPGREETDEDLLKLQEEFLAKKEKLSVKIIKKKDTQPNERSKDVVIEKQLPVLTPTETNPSVTPVLPQSPSYDTSGYMSGHKESPSLVSPIIASEPLATNRRDDIKPRKKSLFALRMEKSRSEAKESTASLSCEKNITDAQNKFGERSYILRGREAEEIHKQNVAQLEKLSVQQIEEERQHLMSQLSSSTIKFLQSRRKENQYVEQKREPIKPKADDALSAKAPLDKVAEDIPAMPSRKGTSMKAFSSSIPSPRSSQEPMQPETDLLATLPIDPYEAKQWLHMDIVEKEKLEWMKELPPAKAAPGPNEPYSARFDFNGLLLPYNDDKIEINKGLHHHGDEPERPGYTLQELMQLSRSSVQQQRIMGLNSLGHVLLKAKLGMYDKVFEQNIIKELLDAGIFLLLRFSLDDVSPPVVVAALTAMRNLIYNEPDEASLDYCLGCEGSLQQPLLEVPYEDNNARKIQEQKDHEAELKDFEIIQLDLLKGAERTNLIVRLGYILDVMKGPPEIVLDVLIRIARHSRHLAEAIVNCGGLLTTIREQLLTTRVISSLAAGYGQPGYGEPSAKALRLMRVLAAHSRVIANTLLDKFNMMEPVMTYVSMSSPELPQIQSLVVQGFYLWQTFMSYGLASQSVIDLFPILMRQLHFHAQLTSASGVEASASGHELATALIGVIERASDIVSSDHNVLDAKPVFQLAKILVDCLRKWVSQLCAEHKELPLWSAVKMVGAAFNCLAGTARCANRQDLPDSRSILEKIESFVYSDVIPFLKGACIQNLLGNLRPCSYFLSSDDPGSKRDTQNLPSLGALEWGGESVVPGLLPSAPHPILSGLLRFMGTTFEIFGCSFNESQSSIFDSSDLDDYIHRLLTDPLRTSNHWFCRQEVYMLHHLLALIILQPSLVSCQHQITFYQLAFKVIDLVQANDKYLIASLLPLTVFNPEFVRWGMKSLPPENDNQDLIEESLLSLSAVGCHYLNILGVRFCRVPPPSQRMSLTSPPKGTEPALPVDWQFAPLLVLYGQYNAQNRERWEERDTVAIVTNCLQFLFLNETLLSSSKSPLSVTARWCRLALVFLAGSDLFLDDGVKRYLKANLNLLLLQGNKLNFSETIPGLSSFYDLYGELLLQYSAVSYCDKLFGTFVLLPLQQRQDPQLRRMVWGENVVIVRMLPTSIEEVGISIEEYLEPCETDPSLLSAYLESVAKGLLVKERCPVLFHVAIHHVSTFIHRYKDHPVALSLSKSINHIGNKAIQKLFLECQSIPTPSASS